MYDCRRHLMPAFKGNPATKIEPPPALVPIARLNMVKFSFTDTGCCFLLLVDL